ncbi:MAG: DUF4249 domain-containing protein [Bacteroidia bacterium]|nr:DUF4249 domain-containing protein [Bacteroidia bacterium]
MRALISIFIFTALLFSSCEDTIQVKLDEGSKLYVIDAFMSRYYNFQSIRVTYSMPYLENADPEPVTNAQVRFHDLKRNKHYDFIYTKDGKYVVSIEGNVLGGFGETGDQYRLDVIIDGITYSATTTVPRLAKIDSISQTLYTKDIVGNYLRPFYLCTLWAKDKADQNPDYYWIKDQRTDTSYINVCIDGNAGIVRNPGSDSIYFSAPFNMLGLLKYYPGTYCNVEVHSITRDTYYFLVQARDQVNNGGMFAKTPQNVPTNFVTPADAKTKAVGWFSVSNMVRASKQLPY